MARFIDCISRGTRAAQPAATTLPDGSLYYVTDELLLEQVNGPAWTTFIDFATIATVPGGADKSSQYNNNGVFSGVAVNATATAKYLQQINGGAPTFQPLSGAGGLIFVAKTELAAAATDITFTALNGDADKLYLAQFSLIYAANGCDFTIKPNNVTTNQGLRRFSESGTDTQTSWLPLTGQNTDFEVHGYFYLHAATTLGGAARYRHILGALGNVTNTPTFGSNHLFQGYWTDTSTNLTSLVLSNSQTNGWKAGSYAALYKHAQS